LPRLLFEKTVSSFPKLEQELGLLDMDSGIRTFGDYAGRRRQFVFVTRSPHDTYVLMVYERAGGGKDPSDGKRLLVKEFRRREELVVFMRTLLSRPVKAYVY